MEDNMILLDGKVVKKEVLEQIKKELVNIERPLGLAVIQVGEDEASKVYVRQKAKMAEELGFNFQHIQGPENVEETELLRKIDELNEDDTVDGILVQMPIPKHLNPSVIQNRINYLKDVDGLTDLNAGCLVHNKESLVPCTPQGIIELLQYYNIELKGKNVTIIGRSDLVGKPLASLMTNNDATVTLCHSKTKNLNLYTKHADILIVAVGKAKLIKEDQIKKGAVIVDVGINRQEDGSLCGDVDFEQVKDKASYITPVPGGVGQMTVACLAKNTYKAFTLRKIKKQ
jgi:methylenetetrahydrofolate dehydrogenase (NADP+)/methenyltetrahydrofolate cyclohydrolase